MDNVRTVAYGEEVGTDGRSHPPPPFVEESKSIMGCALSVRLMGTKDLDVLVNVKATVLTHGLSTSSILNGTLLHI